MQVKSKSFFAALTANITWGFVSIPFRAIKEYPADQILFFRIVVSLVICGLYILCFKKEALKKDINTLMISGNYKPHIILLLSGILITLNWYTFIYVVNEVNLSTAAFAYMICPLITAAAGFILLKEQVTYLKLIAILVATSSIIMLATGSLSNVIWAIITATFYAFYLITQRVLQLFDKVVIIGFNMIVALVLISPLYLIHNYSFPLDLSFWINIFIIATLFTLIPLLLSLYALKNLPSSTVGIIIYINPVVAFGVAFLYFHENITFTEVLAYVLLVIAVIIFNWSLIRRLSSKFGKKEIVNFE